MTTAPAPALAIAASMGDPGGVGPELLARAWDRRGGEGLPAFAVCGSAHVMREAARSAGIEGAVTIVADISEALETFPDALPVVDCAPAEWAPGRSDDDGARAALAALRHATGLAVSGKASALVTAPIAKAAMQRVGFAFPGQTEFVADACNVDADAAVMMLGGPSVKVVPITVHVPLSAVPGLLTVERIRRRVTVAAQALRRDFGIERPRIAVSGLNPHAGEEGRLGDEEIAVIGPAIAALREDGIDARGPLPADAMFHAEARATYDLAAMMYHDQGLIPLKALDFYAGVNTTLGLPIVRTSPDHGTAFAIAGTGAAHAGPTIEAIRWAGEMAARRLG